MKKIIILLMTVSLTGCMSYSFQNINSRLSKPENAQKLGSYPSNYISIINDNKELKEIPITKPTPYITKKDIIGWLVCSKNDDSSFINLFMINNGKIVEKSTGIDTAVKRTCDYLIMNNSYNDISIDINSYSSMIENRKKEYQNFIDNKSNDYLFGSPPTNAQINEAFYKFASIALKDPNSATVNVDGIFKNVDDKLDNDNKYQYVVAAQFNSKNSYGAYAGYKRIFLVMKNGVLIDFYI